MDEFSDPISDLRYEPELTTRDVALLLGVSLSTVRKWVARGHITPVGTFQNSNVFDTQQVLSAHQEIQTRSRATGRVRQGVNSYRVELQPFDRVHPKHHDVVVDVAEAARVIGVSPATIRSWIHRGHLSPLQQSRPRATRLRLGDVISAAHARQLPRRRPKPLHYPPPPQPAQ